MLCLSWYSLHYNTGGAWFVRQTSASESRPFPSFWPTVTKSQVRTLPEVPSSLLHAYLRRASQYCPASLMVVVPQRFTVMRITTTVRYSRGCTGQHRMMNSERVKISSSKKTHRLGTDGVESVTSSKLASHSSLPPIPLHRGPIDAHIGRFHATHRNGVPTTPRGEVVLQEYLKYDRGMASPLVRTPSPPAFILKLTLVLTTTIPFPLSYGTLPY